MAASTNCTRVYDACLDVTSMCYEPPLAAQESQRLTQWCLIGAGYRRICIGSHCGEGGWEGGCVRTRHARNMATSRILRQVDPVHMETVFDSRSKEGVFLKWFLMNHMAWHLGMAPGMTGMLGASQGQLGSSHHAAEDFPVSKWQAKPGESLLLFTSLQCCIYFPAEITPIQTTTLQPICVLKKSATLTLLSRAGIAMVADALILGV